MTDVIVVDDEPGVQAFVHLVLQQVCADCRAAYSAQEALALAARQWPDLFVIDLGLPGNVDGWRLWDDLAQRARGRPLRVIVWGGHLTGANHVEAFRRGAVAVIGKPVTRQRLLQAIAQVWSG
jgi:CheY-like chemotaxis protein